MKQIGDKKIFSVTEINAIAKETLELLTFWVEGEIAECEQISSYNFYKIILKDEKTILPSVVSGEILKGKQDTLRGKRVLVYGNLTLWEPRGQYQFRIYQLEESGEGIFQKELEELIKKLMSQGLFDEKYKKQIPLYPIKVCIVTSYKSAAWNDFKSHTVDEFSLIQLYTADVRVQGKQSIPNLLKILPYADNKGFDVIVITRGGGSIEDLAAFNNEKVARCIFKMKTPTIVAIGHEHNQSLAEWVADKRASTPTGAAYLITQGYYQYIEKLQGYKRYYNNKFDQLIYSNIQNLSYLHNQLESIKIKYQYLPDMLEKLRESIIRHDKRLIFESDLKLISLMNQIKKEIIGQIGGKNNILYTLNKSLTLLSPKNTLMRGYSITTNVHGQIVRSIKAIVAGDTIGVKLTDGKIISKVVAKE
ncbi:exodeoxyribonuclease VII large subunit [Candidatus Curtissbacteria bacterium RIFCSPLOWO2_01_FULL_38_11b]|uniref:Exodeoxyribonuclease 7 large subunit n=1 Tax=Candidatus Curtissbacteria bacterium RIFCSPLOWO2_01_FULL_38_11b TaxID=1797725 RepID=A0A1F5GZI0_9BACT|nr:MAG: exodeoxyribonuclease VII large subunit [Candidatus Curtissbacteria bacterium RIFCSPLOWO2_01_FULL_38_11b]